MITLPSLTADSSPAEILEFMQGVNNQIQKLPAEKWGKMQNHVKVSLENAENELIYHELKG